MAVSTPSKRTFLKSASVTGLAIGAPWVRKTRAADLQTVRMACWSPRLAEEGNIFVSEDKGFFKEQASRSNGFRARARATR